MECRLLQLRACDRRPGFHACLPFASRDVERFKLFARISQRLAASFSRL